MTRKTISTPPDLFAAVIPDYSGPKPKPKKPTASPPPISLRINKATAQRVTALAQQLHLTIGDLADYLLTYALNEQAAGRLKIDAGPSSGKLRIIRP